MNHIHGFIISTTWWIERFPTSPDFIYLVSLWCVWRARVWRKKAGMARPFGLGLASSRSSHSFLASPSLPLHVVLARLVKNSWSMDQHIVVSKRQGGGSCSTIYYIVLGGQNPDRSQHYYGAHAEISGWSQKYYYYIQDKKNDQINSTNWS